MIPEELEKELCSRWDPETCSKQEARGIPKVIISPNMDIASFATKWYRFETFCRLSTFVLPVETQQESPCRKSEKARYIKLRESIIC
jgi:hypothetical protein